MQIREIELNNFRNYRHLKISFSEDINIFLGENAQGKTNLLEGIYLNGMARSFKTPRDREMVRFDQEYAKVKSRVNYEGEDHLIEIVISRDGRKAVKIDGVKINRTSELLQRVYLISFTPEDLKIVKEDPAKRRGFIDREMCQIRPGYTAELNRYRRVLRQRNALLKGEIKDPVVLDIWDQEMAESGSRIIRMRREFIRRIDEISSSIHGSISGGREHLSVSYESNIESKEGKEEEVLLQILKETREKDMQSGSTGKGPHRDDLKISAEGKDLRRYGSQGQQRTAALSLKLSEIKLIEEETGEMPILLLDDVLSELDNERQKYLIHSLGKSQMFITATDLTGPVADSLPEGKVYRIRRGEICE